ncbi:NifU family protein [Nocardioides sp.]|uniref:NifU family protein n=1 Tax=Nocardioides sp. TaxID=35761 RepID=UPI002ED89DED
MTAVALHPEAGTVPEEVRWVVPEAPLPPPGTAVALPQELAALLVDGTLTEVRVLPGCVVTRAPAAADWSRCGTQVRRAVAAAVAEPGRWRTEAGDHPDDRELAAAVRRLLAGDVGDYVRSHGGAIELVGVRHGVVTVQMRGACQGCPASELTLRARFERRLREECPALVDVRAAGPRR